MTNKSFRVRKPPKGKKGGAPVGSKLQVTLSESATLQIKVTKKRKGKKPKALGSISKKLPEGASSITIPKRVGKNKLGPGQHWLELIASNSNGLSSEPRKVTFTIVP